MSTNGIIGIIHHDKTISAITCDYDAYLEYTGKNLYEFYNNSKQVVRLIAQGNVHSIENKIEKNVSHNIIFNHYKNLNQLLEDQRFNDFYKFLYLYDMNNQEWYVQQRENLISDEQLYEDDIAFNYNKEDNWKYYWHIQKEQEFEKLEHVLLQNKIITKNPEMIL